MNNRRLLFAIIFVLLFAIGVIGWFFFYSTPQAAPSLHQTKDPLSLRTFPKRFQFINKGNSDNETSTTTTEVTLQKPEVLTEIWNKPATGQTFIEGTFIREVDIREQQGTTTISSKKLVKATSSILMFVDRTTGYVYAYNREIGKIYQVSNTTIPGVYDAYIFNNGKKVVMRYEDRDKNSIISIFANIPSVNEKEDAKPLQNITFLPSGVTSLASNSNGTLLSYLVNGDNGGSIYTINEKETALIAKTPLQELYLSYGGNFLYATTKPSAYMKGQTVILPSFQFIVGGQTGFMSNPNDKNMFINSMWSNQGLKTFISRDGNQTVLTIRTLASKCSWGIKDFLVCAVPKNLPHSDEGLPDDWFQGRVSFDDSLVVVNTQTTEILPLYSFNTEKNGIFDITNIRLSSDNSYIAFTKKQRSLWLLDTNLLKNE